MFISDNSTVGTMDRQLFTTLPLVHIIKQVVDRSVKLLPSVSFYAFTIRPVNKSQPLPPGDLYSKVAGCASLTVYKRS